MTQSASNPFVFPGLSGGNGNPLLQSLEMMRQAWSGLGPAGGLNPALTQPTLLDPAEIDRRIAELQAVENWLNLNLSMLQGSIRALEVQRATLSTLRSFASLSGMAGSATATGAQSPSPLEVALGLRPGATAAAEPAPATSAEPPPHSPPEGAATTPPLAAFTDPAQAAAAQQAWWNMLQQQFNQIAGAAAASFPTPAASSPSETPESTQAGTATATAPRKAARKTATKTPRKAAPKG